MADNYIDLPVEGGGGGGGGVTSVNGATGAITIAGSSNIDVTTFGTNITLNAVGAANTFAGFNASGDLEYIPGFNQDINTGGLNEFLVQEPNDANQYININNFNVNFQPLQDSPNEGYSLINTGARLDDNNSGFSQGTNGTAVTIQNYDITHHGLGATGNVQMLTTNYNLGNGIDPITMGNVGYMFGFGQINSGVTINQLQGYTFQINAQSGSTITQNVTGYGEYSNLQTSVNGHESFRSSPNVLSIANNSNMTNFVANPSVGEFLGNSNYSAVGVYPNIGIMNQGSFHGIQINPNITTNNNYAVGIEVNMNNVTNAPGAQASLVVQDITYTRNVAGTDGNSITVEYTDTTTAGNEVATLVGLQHIVVSIESGVSTATQVIAALAANFSISSNITSVISGTASNPQVAYSQTNLAGGVNPGTKRAAYFGGDVQIDGALSFSGALSIGALNSFASVDISGFPPGVNSIDTLITQPTVPANTTLTTDLLAINTAMLLNVGANSTLTSSFLGYTALGLPAVAAIGANSSVDLVCGAAFAISLDAGAGAGSSIGEVALCRALAIPNGITSVSRLVGYKMDLPFGDPGTTTFGLYITPTAHNYMAGDLVIGGTPSSDDTPTNGSVALEIKSTVKAFRLSNMTTAQRDALTALPGMVIFNIDTAAMEFYDGTAWM